MKKPSIRVGHVIGLTLAGSTAVVGLALVYLSLVTMGALTVPAWALPTVSLLAAIVGVFACILGVLFLVFWLETAISRRSARH